ncbi:hypothetical protein R3P38DRAFT_2604844 [Favolaschia claudopus]|uniref:DUF6589 domain-containing protein n=1 Tax=Favolaschia claudopus TaxID=2862362 RepID=A0AAW0DFM7_9AGAR
MRQQKRTKWQKVDNIVQIITKDFRSLGAFLEALFHIRDNASNDPRTARHEHMVTAFLQGASNTGIATIIDLIYHHPQSRPARSHPETELYFAPPNVSSPRDIRFAQPSLSTWAIQRVGPEMRRQIGVLTQNDPADPHDTTQLRASTNGRAKHVRVVTWEDLGRVSIPWMAQTYQRRAPGVWFITECMGAPTEKGVIVVRVRRPHPTVQVGVISSLTLSRNRYASGYLALPLAIWQFACKAHVDEKRIMSRFGFSVHDTTARACLDSLTDSSMSRLRALVKEGIANGTHYWQFVLDNIQEYCRQRDHRIGREDVLKIGTAATAILMEDCAAGAFDLQDHLDRVLLKKRDKLTTDSLFHDIDWPYIQRLMALHWVLVLVAFVPTLSHLRKEVSALFNVEPMTRQRLRPRKSVMQPLGTNAERETETQGMMRAILDFMNQMGLDEAALDNLIFMARGDGASVAAMWRIKKFLAHHPSHYKAFRNLLPPGPEIWHTRWTQLNALSSNYYGPIASRDPSSLSKSATAAGAKRPSNLGKVDFFPTSRSMELFYEARVLDCWRVYFEADDIIEHFAHPQATIPDIDSLWASAEVLVRRYASQDAYNQALNIELSSTANSAMSIPRGSTWSPPVANSRNHSATVNSGNVDIEMEGHAEDAPVDDVGEAAGLEEFFADSGANGKKKKKKKKAHTEAPNFQGDRALANEILFLQDMGWWIIAAHAVPEGEMGRIWEVMKIWIFNFSGSTNHNYANYLLETYCLHRYEASKELSDAIFNNSLVNPSGFKFVECDFNQEGYNKWLEEMVEHKGGNFDEHFYRHTLAPNVIHFLRMKDQIQSAFELKSRGKTHTSPHLRNEFQQLLRMHKEDELHLFVPGRTYGHAAVNFLERGYERLEEGRMNDFIKSSTAYADIMTDAVNSASIDEEMDEEFMRRALAEMIAEANKAAAEEAQAEEDEEESSSENGGDPSLRGMEYSDDESEAESDEEDFQVRQTDEFIDGAESEGESGGEDASEAEEERIDQFIIGQ